MGALRAATLLTLGLEVLCAKRLRAQIINYHADSAKIAKAADAGASLVHWVQTSPGAEEHTIYVRNISQQLIRVTSYEVYNCVDVRGRACGIHSPGPLVKPGQTVRLIVIDFGMRRGSNGSYQYRVSSTFVATDSTPPDTTRH